jgi:hypothetical protein
MGSRKVANEVTATVAGARAGKSECRRERTGKHEKPVKVAKIPDIAFKPL